MSLRVFLILCLLWVGCEAGPPASAVEARGNADERPLVEVEQLAREVHREVAAARQHHQLPAYGWRDDLALVATDHSTDMQQRGFFDHVAPDGSTPTDRSRRRGIDCRTVASDGQRYVGVAENLFQSWLYSGYRTWRQGADEWRTYDWRTTDQLARETVQGWLDSPPHRRALLDPDSRDHGIGVAIGDSGKVLVTQLMC